MPESLSKLLEIDSADILNRGAFDPLLDIDTKLFIDPHLLKHCDIPDFYKVTKNCKLTLER